MGFWSAIPIIGEVVDGVMGLIDQNVEDKDKARETKAVITTALLNADLSKFSQQINAQAKIVTAEAQGESWFQRNWRPVVMLTFAGLIVAHWLGWTAPNLGEKQILSLLDLVKIGLGGYVVGRSGEKIAKELGPALAKRGRE